MTTEPGIERWLRPVFVKLSDSLVARGMVVLFAPIIIFGLFAYRGSLVSGLLLGLFTFLMVLAITDYSAWCGFGGGGRRGVQLIIIYIGVMVGVGIPNLMDALDKTKPVKDNMHALKLGVEQFAKDHHGNYPDSVLSAGFDWSTYVPSQPKNPYNQNIVGVANMEADVQTTTTAGDPGPRIASSYSGKGRPGTMRYFADTGNHAMYAIIGYDQDGSIIKGTTHRGGWTPNYILLGGRPAEDR